MNIEDFRLYCLSKPGVTEGFPFDETTLVFKLMGKMFALTDTEDDFAIALKCDPERAIELREKYPAVKPGFHMNKIHWNTITVDGSMNNQFLIELTDHSYDLIKSGLTKKLKAELQQLEKQMNKN
ncbi:MAG: MmcQ/YjbR family DNA-binding protein [Bacteroidales bacterium]|jgi:predicted DNA-binding protein (MmcQ/YjbR family)|nr:MmcQ/YjbR family DNA-binding protein [Bacteroidales bacterium]